MTNKASLSILKTDTLKHVYGITNYQIYQNTHFFTNKWLPNICVFHRHSPLTSKWEQHAVSPSHPHTHIHMTSYYNNCEGGDGGGHCGTSVEET